GFDTPSGIWGNSTDLYVADTGNFVIRKVAIATAQVSTVAGLAGEADVVDGPSNSARFGSPAGITGTASTMYVTEVTNRDVRRISITSGDTSTVAGRPSRPGTTDGQGSSARFTFPLGISGDPLGIYIADNLNSTVRRIDTSLQATSTFAGFARLAF